MSEEYLPISNLNDFIFCPVSIYFHSLDHEAERILSQCEKQINGSSSHSACDEERYSDKRTVFQGLSVISEEYGLIGKIDVFDSEIGILTERKKKINKIYDGYVFQLYAQYFALCEMGYTVKKLRLYSMDDNKVYDIPLPEEDDTMFMNFKKLIDDIQIFKFHEFRQTNGLKCKKCIYEPLCSYSNSGSDIQ